MPAPDEIVALTQRQVDRVGKVVRTVEQMGGKASAPVAGGANLQYVKISSTTQASGRYPGNWYLFDAVAATYAVKTAVWIDTPNGETLVAGQYYQARRVGTHTDGKAIFQTDRIGSLTVKDASTTLTNITTINVGGEVFVSSESPTGTANLSSAWTYVTNGSAVNDARGNAGPSGVTIYSGASDSVWVRGGPLWVFTGNGAGCIYFAPSFGYTTVGTHKGFVQGTSESTAIGVSLTNDSFPGVPGFVAGQAKVSYSYPTSTFETRVDEHQFTGSAGGATAIKVHNGSSLQTGYTGTVAGMVFVCGLYVSGSPTSGTITFGTTATSGGTSNGVAYSNGSTMNSASNMLIDSGGSPVINLGSGNFLAFAALEAA